MKNTSVSHFHGYENSTLDNAVRLRLTNGQIVALRVTPSGIEARLLGRVLRLPKEMHQLSDVSRLVSFLKAHRLGLAGEEIIIEQQTNGGFPRVIKTSPPISPEDL